MHRLGRTKCGKGECMQPKGNAAEPDVFISYASRDREQVGEIVRLLESAGVSVWRDKERILGGESYGPRIVHAIKHSRVMVLMCTNASIRSRNVNVELHLAWNYCRPLLPLHLEPVSYTEQVEYWLVGPQWIEVLDRPQEQWLLRVLQSLAAIGVKCNIAALGAGSNIPEPSGVPSLPVRPVLLSRGIKGLQAVASFNDRIWPMPADRAARRTPSAATRGLGAPQDNVQHGYCLGSHVRLAIELDRPGNLVLLDEGPEGNTYCLCPSQFAADPSLPVGLSFLPQSSSRFDSFVLTGRPGREHLTAIITDQPLQLEWMPTDPRVPARVLTPDDIALLLSKLDELDAERWTVMSTYFDVVES